VIDRRQAGERALVGAAGLVLGAAVASSLVGGSVSVGPWTMPLRAFWRPVAIGLLLLAARVAWGVASPGDERGDARRMAVVDALVGAGFVCGVAAAWFLWCHYQVRVCGGSDSYGYVSAAAALADGAIIRPAPLASALPFAGGILAVTPLGWVPAASGTAIVPGYPLGFPIVAAILVRAAGLGAAFYVPLAAGTGILVLTYRLARSHADAWVAGAATLVVAFNPVLTNMAVQPMSDAPAAFWYMLAVVSLAGARRRPVMAGLAFGMAVWTRPLVAVMFPALLLATARDRRVTLRLLLGGAPVACALALTQWYLYGSPLRTGYGGTAGLFTTSNITRHLGAYAWWLVAAHSPLFVAALAAGVWRGPRRLAWASVTGLAMAVVPYLFNVQFFDDFDLIRYLLPALVPCLVVATLGVGAMAARVVPARARGAAMLALAACAASASFAFTSGTFTFRVRQQESRYVEVADWVRTHTPAGAVVLSDLHSGPLRLYAERETLRWVMIPEGRFGATIDVLAARGMPCYAAADGDVEARGLEQRVARDGDGIVAEPVARVRTVMLYRVYRRS
jgi:hypothetical protein